ISGNLQSYHTTQTAVCENPSDNGGWKRAVAWIGDEEKVHIQPYNSYGVKVGNEKTYTNANLSSLNLTADDSGTLLATWQVKGSGTNTYYIYAASYKDGQFSTNASWK